MDTITDKTSLPDTARWDALLADFRAGAAPRADVCVTVCAEVPLAEEGERLGAVRRFARRAARKAVRWYVEALLARQNRVNRAMLAELETLRARVAELERTKAP